MRRNCAEEVCVEGYSLVAWGSKIAAWYTQHITHKSCRIYFVSTLVAQTVAKLTPKNGTYRNYMYIHCMLHS